jgi:hypothetical protein
MLANAQMETWRFPAPEYGRNVRVDGLWVFQVSIDAGA